MLYKAINKKIALISGTLLVTMSAGMMLTGCQQAQNILGQNNAITKTVGTSKHTDDSDRKNYTLLQDINGKQYTTVMSVTENNGTNKFDQESFEKFLNTNNINWYQMIATNSMGTNNNESCYLFFPASISFADMQNVMNTINASGTFNATILDEKTYKNYADNVNSFNFYKNETTYYGPAASQN